MLLIFIAFLLALAAILVIGRLRIRRELLESESPKIFDGENLRPLFAPDEAEMRAIVREEVDLADARRQEEVRIQADKRLESFNEFRQTWRESKDRTNTIELIRRASEMERGEIYLKTVETILHDRPDGLNDADLAQLIESHFWLLPKNERTPGVTFTINRELAALRGGSVTMSEEEASDA